MARRKQSPEVAEAMRNFKFEVAGELGIPLNDYDNGDVLSRDCGRIGGTMVKRLVGLGQQALVANFEAVERRKQIQLIHSQKRPKVRAAARATGTAAEKVAR
ncbi:MAG: small, acid-soluble spore protein, alpha/beta type [Thermincolia bacterium]